MPGSLSEGVSGESREVLEKLYLAEDYRGHHHRLPRGDHLKFEVLHRRHHDISIPAHRAKIPELLHEFFLKNREHLRHPARVR
jgi:hypothetical protein